MGSPSHRSIDGVLRRRLHAAFAGSSIYAAVQNLMLAAPPSDSAACYPDGQNFGPTTRKPVESVTFWDDWGETRTL